MRVSQGREISGKFWNEHFGRTGVPPRMLRFVHLVISTITGTAGAGAVHDTFNPFR